MAPTSRLAIPPTTSDHRRTASQTWGRRRCTRRALRRVLRRRSPCGCARHYVSAMRRVPAVLVAICLTVIGCSASDVDPDATVRISGRALDAQGRPLSGAKVLLFKQADFGEIILGTTLAIGTLSTICLLPDPPAVCNKARTVTTDRDGAYEFELKGSDTQGTMGTESTLNVVFSGPKA